MSVSSKKREAIIDAALKAFLEYGYGATTIDQIVNIAGGSKATIYKHFKDKDDLFNTVIDRLVKTGPMSQVIDVEEDPAKALVVYAESRLKAVFYEEHSSLRRLVVGESGRFPNIARSYYETGPGYGHEQLHEYFNEHKKRGTLDIDDADLAASIFQGMLIHSHYLKTLYLVKGKYSQLHLKQHAEKVVEKFMRIYPPVIS
jgi:TetR/AcrR family transcriptional repressor of mexJK operon